MAENKKKGEKGELDGDLGWFKETHPGAKAEFPPIQNLNVGEPYLITFKEPKPRVVPDKFNKTAVIEIEYKGQLRSLFLGHTYLAQQLYALQKKHGTLMDLKVTITRLKKTKDYIEYLVQEV